MLRTVAIIAVIGIAMSGCKSGGDHEGARRSTDARTLLLDWTSRELAPVDPVTLDPLSGDAPLPMGHWASNYVSPDGRMLASIIGETQDVQGKLHVFDLVDWSEKFVFEEQRGALYPAVWAADSRQFYAVAGDESQSLWAIDAEDLEARKVADFDYSVDRVDVSPDGLTVYLFAFELADERTYTVAGDPFLVAVDVGSGEENARVNLPSMLMGQRKEGAGTEQEHYATYYPGRAMAPDGRRYYVAHAEDDEITVVNLETMEVEKTAVPQRPRSLFERIINRLLGGGVAGAKGGEATSKQITASPDGKRLFVTGGHDSEPAPNGPTFRPFGLKVLDAESLEILTEHEGIATLSLSPDGTLAFATGWSSDWTQTGPNEFSPGNYNGGGLEVIDANTGELTSRFEPDRIFESVVTTADGRFAYLISYSPEYKGLAWRQNACDVPCQTVTVYDIAQRRSVGERAFPTHGLELVSAAAGR